MAWQKIGQCGRSLVVLLGAALWAWWSYGLEIGHDYLLLGYAEGEQESRYENLQLLHYGMQVEAQGGRLQSIWK